MVLDDIGGFWVVLDDIDSPTQPHPATSLVEIRPATKRFGFEFWNLETLKLWNLGISKTLSSGIETFENIIPIRYNQIIYLLIDYKRLVVHGSWLKAHGSCPKARGSRPRIFWRLGLGPGWPSAKFSWPWAKSLEAWAVRLEPWTMNHLLLIID